MSKDVILLNAPPRAGKDTAAEWFENNSNGLGVVEHMKFSKLLKERTHAMYGNAELPYDHFESSKDTPQDFFLGISPRQAYINFSELYMKPVHGQSVWVDLLSTEINNSLANTIVISDLGFQVEFDRLRELNTDIRFFLLKIYRKGYDFSNDSRDYVKMDGRTWWQKLMMKDKLYETYETEIHNDETLERFYDKLEFIKEKVILGKVDPLWG